MDEYERLENDLQKQYDVKILAYTTSHSKTCLILLSKWSLCSVFLDVGWFKQVTLFHSDLIGQVSLYNCTCALNELCTVKPFWL